VYPGILCGEIFIKEFTTEDTKGGTTGFRGSLTHFIRGTGFCYFFAPGAKGPSM
jgi:hypothetical protein